MANAKNDKIYSFMKTALGGLVSVQSTLNISDSFINEGFYAQIELTRENRQYENDEHNDAYFTEGTIDYIIYIGVQSDRQTGMEIRENAHALADRTIYELEKTSLPALLTYSVASQTKKFYIDSISVEDINYPMQTDNLSGILQIAGKINYS